MAHFKFILVVLFAGIAVSSKAQTQADFPGDWNVTKVVVPDKTGQVSPDEIKKIENLFLQTQFHFKTDGIFVIDSPQKVLQFKKSNWVYNDKDKALVITGTDMTNKEGQLLKLFVKTDGGKWSFTIDEAMIQLDVEKVVKK